MEEAVRKSPKNKATGLDDLSEELLKTDDQQMTEIACQLYSKILESGEWQTDSLRTIFIPVSKISGTAEGAKHRIISLINCAGKVLRILLSRMTKTAEQQMSFKKKVEIKDQIKSSTFE